MTMPAGTGDGARLSMRSEPTELTSVMRSAPQHWMVVLVVLLVDVVVVVVVVVVEVLVPRLQWLPPGETFQPFAVGPTHLGFDEYDVVRQGLVSHHYWIEDGSVDIVSPPFRYVWPSELDLMAQLAGMTLRERWGDWSREPFTAASAKHVSVWETPSAEVARNQ